MTTIAYKDKVMVSDTQATYGSHRRTALVQKIHFVAGGLLGRSGSGDEIHTFDDRFYAIESEKDFVDFLKEQAKTFNQTVCLFVRRDNPNVVYWGQTYKHDERNEYDYTVSVFDVSDGTGVAVGSGGDYAEVAMYCGQSAEDAVRTASHFDIYTNDIVDVFEF